MRNQALPFQPAISQVMTVGTGGSDRIALSLGLGRQIVLSLASTAEVCFVAFGSATVEASTAASMAIIPGGATFPLSIPDGATHMAAVSGTAGQTLYVTEGVGS